MPLSRIAALPVACRLGYGHNIQFTRVGTNAMAQQDIQGATDTYAGFIALFKWGAISGALIVALVLVLIS